MTLARYRNTAHQVPGSHLGTAARSICCAWALACNLGGVVTGARAADPPTEPSTSRAEVVATIDRYVRQGWADAQLKPSEPATEGEWCRRVFLDLIGRIPQREETEAYLADRAPTAEKKRRLVDQLLDSEEYAEQFSRQWSTIWTNLLIGRTAGTEQNTLVSRAGMQQYLRRSFVRNKPYDQMVTELLTAVGANEPGLSDYNGAVNYLLSVLDDKNVQATAKTSRLFLGIQVQCMQCHDHKLRTGKQSEFWGMNAFFRQLRSLSTFDGRDRVEVRLADQDFAGEGGDPLEAECYYELPNGQLAAIMPRFVDGTEISPVGYVDEVNRRQELAKKVVSAETFGPALVNRLWSHFLGYGFTKPVDDFGAHNPATHPELLAELSTAFRAQGYDLKRVMRWIVLSEAYGLSSQATSGNQRDDPALGEKPWFSRFYLRQMTAEELYESLLVAMRAEETVAGSAEELERRKQAWLQQFAVAFGNDEGGEATTFDGSIPQALMMMNGELIAEASSDAAGSFLAQLAAAEARPDARIRALYLAALSRLPTRKELGLATQIVNSAERPLAGLQDVWWAVLNSNEFILNH